MQHNRINAGWPLLKRAAPSACANAHAQVHLMRQQIEDEDAQLVVQHERLLDELVRASGHVVLCLRAQRHHCIVLLPPCPAANLHTARSNIRHITRAGWYQHLFACMSKENLYGAPHEIQASFLAERTSHLFDGEWPQALRQPVCLGSRNMILGSNSGIICSHSKGAIKKTLNTTAMHRADCACAGRTCCMLLSVVRLVHAAFCHMQKHRRFSSRMILIIEHVLNARLLTDSSSCMRAPDGRRMPASCGVSNTSTTQLRARMNEQDTRHCIDTPALRAISRAAEFLGAAAGRRMHLVLRGHELFSAHLNPRKSQHCASVWYFASSAFCARPCSVENRFALVWPT